jgi:C_GCAxxG_C_C family probable redox protein
MKNRIELALYKLKSGYNCAQAVLFSFCDEIGLEEDLALKLATGFGSGMGKKQEVCGAISGGIMVINARYGRGQKENNAATEGCYQKTHALMDRFEQRHGTYLCRQLLDGCELATKKGMLLYKAKGLRKKTCTPCVQSVVEILEEIL